MLVSDVKALPAAVAALCLCVASRALAADTPAPPDSTIILLDEVQVRSARPVTTSGGSGAVTANVDSLGLSAAPSMEDVLRKLPGAHVRTNSRGEAEISVRGSESRQVAVLLDGIPLTFAWDGRTDVSVIPAQAAQEVTLVRGVSTLMHGPNTLGGVVEFNTGAADPLHQVRRMRAHAGVDHVGGYRLAASVTMPRQTGFGVFTARAGVGHQDSPGQPLARGIKEPVTTGDELRLNTDRRQSDAFLAFRADTRHGAFASVSGTGYSLDRGMAAQLGVSDPRLWRYPKVGRGIGILSAGSGKRDMPWGGRADLELSAGLDKGRTEINEYATRDYAAVTGQEVVEGETWTVRAVGSQSLGDGAQLQLGFTHGDIHHDETVDQTTQEYRQKLWSVSAQTLAVTAGAGPVENFDLSLGITYDGASTPLSGDKPSLGSLDEWGGRAGVAARLGGGGTTLHASVSRRARFPSLRELYSGALGTFDPNPGLRPENLVAVETGLTSRTPQSAFQVLAFYHLLSDAVVRIRPPGVNYRRVNQEGIRSAGVEFQGSRSIGAVGVSADLMAQDVEVRDPAAGLTQPENMPELAGGVRVELPLWPRAAFACDARYTGKQFAIDPDTGNDATLAAAGRLGLSVTQRWALGGSASWIRHIEAIAAVDNVTNAVQYDAFGLPMPGIAARLELRVN